jgi:hypothetical protein
MQVLILFLVLTLLWQRYTIVKLRQNSRTEIEHYERLIGLHKRLHKYLQNKYLKRKTAREMRAEITDEWIRKEFMV